jgi:hypothetical protein
LDSPEAIWVNPKKESRKKMTKSLPKHYAFQFFYCCCALKYHAAANFLTGGRESFENGRGLVFARMWP